MTRLLRVCAAPALFRGAVCLAAVAILTGCATGGRENRVLATVDGSPIYESDLRYSLSVAHRRESMTADSRVEFAPFLDKVINDRLLADEAVRMGLDGTPEFTSAYSAYLLRESVTRLRAEEILEKSTPTREELEAYYREEFFHYRLIQVADRDAAENILRKVRLGDDFAQAAREFSVHPSGKHGGEFLVQKRSQGGPLGDALGQMSAGQISDVITDGKAFYIVMTLGFADLSPQQSGSIERELSKRKIKEREDSYLAELRAKAPVTVDSTLIEEAAAIGDSASSGKLLEDQRVVARVGDAQLTLGEFASMVQKTPAHLRQKKSSMKIIDRWIDVKVIDHEALSRHYELVPDFRASLEHYRVYLLSKIFTQKAIYSEVDLSEQKLQQCYDAQKDSYRIGTSYKVQALRAATPEEAAQLEESLNKGSDFGWLLKKQFKDTDRDEEPFWVTEDELPQEVREGGRIFSPGEITPAFSFQHGHVIFRVLEKNDARTASLPEVIEQVRRECFQEQFSTVLDDYLAELRRQATIVIDEQAVKSMQERFH